MSVWSNIQDGAGFQSSGTVNTGQNLTYSSAAIAVGDLLTCCIGSGGSSGPSFTVTDNQGNTWTLAKSNTGSSLGGKPGCFIYYFVATAAVAAGSYTVTVTPGGAYYVAFNISQFRSNSGVSQSPIPDQTHGQNGASTTAFTSGNVITTVDNELYIGINSLGNNTAGTTTNETGWNDHGHATGTGTKCDYRIESQGDGTDITHGTYAATWTGTSNAAYAACIATFEPASGFNPANGFPWPSDPYDPRQVLEVIGY